MTRRHDESTVDEPATARQRRERRLNEQPNFFDGEAFFDDEAFFAEDFFEDFFDDFFDDDLLPPDWEVSEFKICCKLFDSDMVNIL
jgi:hypothetical protein